MAKFCPNCGSTVADEAINCTVCGSLLAQQQGPMGQPMSQPMGQPMGQPMDQSMGQPMGQPVPPTNPVAGQPMGQPMGQPVPPTNPVAGQPMGGQPYGQPMGQPYNQVNMAGAKKSDGCAVASFVCGIVGVLCCSFAAIAAIICGILSLNNIKSGKSDGKQKWMSVAGIILGVIGIAIWIFNIINMGTLDI